MSVDPERRLIPFSQPLEVRRERGIQGIARESQSDRAGARGMVGDDDGALAGAGRPFELVLDVASVRSVPADALPGGEAPSTVRYCTVEGRDPAAHPHVCPDLFRPPLEFEVGPERPSDGVRAIGLEDREDWFLPKAGKTVRRVQSPL